MKRLKAYEKEIEYCSYCPKLCRFACPVAKVTCSEASTPTGKMTLLKLVKDGVIELNAELVEIFYQCSGCLLSRTYCEHQIEVIGAFEAVRSLAVEKEIAPRRVLEFGSLFQKRGNPYNENFQEKIQKLFSKKTPGKSSILVFAGCTMAHYFPETIKDLAKVLERLNFSFEIFAQEASCCGYPLFALGHWKLLEEHKKQLAEKLTGYELILSLCPTCVWFLKTHYQKAGLIEAKQIQHTTDFISSRLNQFNLHSPLSKKVVYHDPCHLGRYLGIYEPPREILKWLIPQGFSEFYENREHAECCGGGGGLALSLPNIAREISRHKIQQFQALGGEILATACPMCERMLSRTGKNAGIQVRDLVSLLAEAIE